MTKSNSMETNVSWHHMVPQALTTDILRELVELYPKLIDEISCKRGSKSHSSLEQLDGYRYGGTLQEAIDRRVSDSNDPIKGGYIHLDELQRLLEWKMSRGVFRPTLRGLIASNSDEIVQKTTSEAFQCFRNGLTKKADVLINAMQAIKILCKLRGVGPATASLVLSVAFPSNVPFFGDELFVWISLQKPAELQEFFKKKSAQSSSDIAKSMRVDKIMGIKYTEAEYKTLFRQVMYIQQSLGDKDISATDIEKAAFVVLQCSEAQHLDLSGIQSTQPTNTEAASKGSPSGPNTIHAESSAAGKASSQTAAVKSPIKTPSASNNNKKRGRTSRSSTVEQNEPRNTRSKRLRKT